MLVTRGLRPRLAKPADDASQAQGLDLDLPSCPRAFVPLLANLKQNLSANAFVREAVSRL